MRLWRVSGGKRRNPLEALVADLKAQLEANMPKAAKVIICAHSEGRLDGRPK
jgi:hypothetical protein